MNRRDAILAAGFAVFSLLTSFYCVFYAVSVIGRGHGVLASPFAYVAGGYGLMNVYALSAAWRSRAPWAEAAGAVISFTFFGVYLVDRLRHGFSSGLGYWAAVVIAGILAVNWLAIRKLVRRD